MLPKPEAEIAGTNQSINDNSKVSTAGNTRLRVEFSKRCYLFFIMYQEEGNLCISKKELEGSGNWVR